GRCVRCPGRLKRKAAGSLRSDALGLRRPFMPRRNLFAIVMVAAVSLLCWQTSHGARPKDKDDAMELYGLFVDAVEQIEANYVRPVNRRELLESALRGMLQNLDPHSNYINEADWR